MNEQPKESITNELKGVSGGHRDTPDVGTTGEPHDKVDPKVKASVASGGRADTKDTGAVSEDGKPRIVDRADLKSSFGGRTADVSGSTGDASDDPKKAKIRPTT
jgi:hypothetical protein